MITKSDWDAVRQQFLADERRRGEPPTSEEMLAYMCGELSPEQEEQMRERLIGYPELVRALSEPFPEEDPSPGDPDYVSDEEMDRRWAALQSRIHGNATQGGRVFLLWRASAFLAAAALALVFGGLLWKAQWELRQPRVLEEQVLEPDGRRGVEDSAAVLSANGDTVVLVVPLIGAPNFNTYRLEIVDVAGPPRVRWHIEDLRRSDNQSFSIVVSRKFLSPSIYQIALYGTDGAREDRVATYSLRVPAR